MNKGKFKEFVSKQVAQNPESILIAGILLFNVLFLGISAFLILQFAPAAVAKDGFWACFYYAITMILDAGCIGNVVTKYGEIEHKAVVIICLVTVIIGMITFTGAVIGYITNVISGFIEKSNSGSRKLNCSNHTIILNWNTRASEIINDLLYSTQKEFVVVLVETGKDEIKKEIENRISETLSDEMENHPEMRKSARRRYIKKLRKNVNIIVREGNIFSTKQLNDVSIKKARAVIILGSDVQNTTCRFDLAERMERKNNGNSVTVKTLIQVAEFTSAQDSFDDQKIIVEVDDDWTLFLVNKIVEEKEKLGKCNIIPLPVNRVLGQILSQFTVMPELNKVYSTLLSNKGAAFYCKPSEKGMEHVNEHIQDYLNSHRFAIPLTTMKTKGDKEVDFYMSGSQNDIDVSSAMQKSPLQVDLRKDFWLEKRNIIILGHNSNCESIMSGFDSFSSEWDFDDKNLIAQFGESVLDILVIDDKKSLEKHNHYEKYPYVKDYKEAEIFEREDIYAAIKKYISAHSGDVSILVLSDDTATTENLDANVLTYLVYIRDIVGELSEEYKKAGKKFDEKTVDVVAEIIDPKNYAIISNYNVKNIVISNRYISKLMTQVSEKEELFEFYQDILSYDENDSENGDEGKTDEEKKKEKKEKSFKSKEIYVKKAARFFNKLPPKCTAAELIRAVYDAEPDENKKSVVLGYVRDETDMVIFDGNQSEIEVELTERDKIILFAPH